MELVRTSSVSTIHVPTSISKTQLTKPNLLNFQFNPIPSSSFSRIHGKTSSKSKLFTTISPSPSSVSTESIGPPEPEVEDETKGEKFDWYAQWYPLMPVCDLDKRVPHAKKVLGLDVVVWWDRNESEWKVFDDACPHRLAPLSEGRIDQWGRLQCVYHGWCFNGSGDCKLIPQAPPDGPPVIIISLFLMLIIYSRMLLHYVILFSLMLALKYYYMVTFRSMCSCLSKHFAS
uniref:Rieske domain-containing protein n=1 Tax=Salix viminalis TaxID=40686 RepID=A0A6N2M7B3_SALVM